MMVTLFDQERETKLYLESLVRETREEAREAGLEEGREDTLVLSVRSLVEKLDVTPEEAAGILEIPEEERQAVFDRL